jgi:hypothetical protein
MATKKRKRFAEGGISEAADKESGLKASKGEKVGFFERLRMGNIDDEGSEAYRRFGAGRGKAERTPVETMDAKPVEAIKPSQSSDYEDRLAAGRREGERKDTGDASVAEMYSGPRTKPIERISSVSTSKPSSSKPSATTKPAASSSGKTSAYPMTGAQPTTKTYDRSGGPTAEELSNYKPPSKLTKKQQIEQEIDSIKPTAEQTQKGLEAASVMAGGVGLKGLQALAKKLAAPKLAKYSQDALPAPTKRLSYDKAGAVTRAREARAAARQEEMLKENAARYGLDPKAPGYEAAAGAIRKDLGGKDFSFKRGGAVKKSATPMKKMASGGMTSKASSRGDGIAQRGKTRGKIY